MNYRLTYDFGSGSVKAALVDEAYQVIDSVNQPYTTYFPQLGWALQKPEENWQSMVAATRTLLKRNNVSGKQIEGIAMAQTATTIIFTDEDGNAVTDCIMWMDGRAQEQADRINQKLGEERFSGKNVIAKLLWFLENQPEVAENAAYMLDLSAYLFHRMTGEWAYEFTGSRATCLVDIEKRTWDPEMFELIGFPKHLVPERIASSEEMIGRITEKAADELGLAENIPVFGGCSDHATAILGTGCIHPGDAHIYIGTSAWLAVTTDANDPNPGRMPSPVRGSRYHFYDTDSGGTCLDYLQNTYYQMELQSGMDVFAVMNQEIMNAMEKDRDEDVLFLPFLAGASAPISNTTVRASLLNLKRSTQRQDIARAVMEGICFNLRWMRDIHAEKNGWNVNCLRGIGGGMKSPVFAQMLADVLQTPISLLRNPRFAGNVGLSVCINIGLGKEKDYTSLEQIVAYEKIFYPQEDTKERYDRLYSFYRQSYRAMEPIYKELNVNI
ncbi:MAG: FGGY family carbohydrate kinase [Eubacteriales bacterium]|nr:FGGY family carbohydrate kinase [Eubacteriales bacterium]